MSRNEAETRADLIDPALHVADWRGDDCIVRREFAINLGRLHGVGGRRAAKDIADYVLIYKEQQLAVIEAKRESADHTEGLGQAKHYAAKLATPFAFSTNGHKIYRVDMRSGDEGEVKHYPTPDELWAAAYGQGDAQAHFWRERFSAIPFEYKGGQWEARYFQHHAITKTLEAIAQGRNRILLTLATGTGKTAIAFQVAWKLFRSRWNLAEWRDGIEEGKEPSRRPRILFLTDRNILADQAFNDFSAFPEDAMVRITPGEIRRNHAVPTNASVFFTIFQTFTSGRDCAGNPKPSFGQYPSDFFDFIIIDECHRGGAHDESTWRGIMEYFSPAVQLGLTATPKRTDNIDTYRYFGEPVYVYSLKEGINDGYLTPFKVKQVATTLDNYIYAPDDDVIEGEVEEGRVYTESDFNRRIEIEERERKRVRIFMNDINQEEKTLVFCANQNHALLVRNLINQAKEETITNPDYCHRVTANDGALGEQHLRTFRDNEQKIPTILTTSRKLSTGVDARNIRNIVLMRPINSIIEFKQIIGRGTRLFDGKNYFTIYDFVNASDHFADSDWDGDPLPPEPCLVCGEIICICVVPPCPRCGQSPCECRPTVCEDCGQIPCVCRIDEVCRVCLQMPCQCNRTQMIRVQLADGKEREIRHIMATSYYNPDGTPMSAEEYIKKLFDELPVLFKNEDELRALWSKPDTRRKLLADLTTHGYSKVRLAELSRLINAEKSDLYDVLAYLAYALPFISREERVANSKENILSGHSLEIRNFLGFVLNQYISKGVSELDDQKLPDLMNLNYGTVLDGINDLNSSTEEIRQIFADFQQHLYAETQSTQS
ncbi:MAG: EcoAI/FtnUII family type I restriction enzme subunit R [bacterium]